MKAIRTASRVTIAPFNEPVSQLPVLGRSLETIQREVLASCGFECVDASVGECLFFSDNVWFTSALVKEFWARCPVEGGQLAIKGPFLDYTRPLQGFPDGEQIVGLPVFRARGTTTEQERLALPKVVVELDVRVHQSPKGHLAFEGITDVAIPVTDRMVHTIQHWFHVHRINLLALIALGEGHRRSYERAPWWHKFWTILTILARARSINGFRIASSLNQVGQGCKIHPTAVLEACIVEDDVEIGPFAYVNGSYLAKGAKVQEHAQVHASVIGENATVGRGAMCRMNVLMAGSLVSRGKGLQGSVVGRDAFLAVGTTVLDVSFGTPIHVSHNGVQVSTETQFLGACIGHEAKIGPHVRIGYGQEVPNGVFLVDESVPVIRDRSRPKTDDVSL